MWIDHGHCGMKDDLILEDVFESTLEGRPISA